MEFHVLGPLEALDRGRTVDVGTPRVRTLLATLLLQANRVVSVDELVERMWGEQPPGNPRRTVQTNVARLRLALADNGQVVQTRERGYLIEVDQWQLDLLRFRSLVEQAHPGVEPERRLRLLEQGLKLWRGEPLTGMTAESLARDEVPRLAEERLCAQETLIDVRLGLGQHAELISELTSLTRRHPLRERLWGFLILALFRSSRQADALNAYRALARTLADELGLDPSDELRRLHRAVLTGDQALAAPLVGGPPVRPSWTVESQLPLDVADFVGRRDVLDRVDDLLSIGGTPVVTVAGPPGVGKTTLIVRAAHRLRWRFPDGQWYVRLGGASGPRDPAEVLADLLRTSGMDPADVPERLDARAATLRSRLADRKVLLVFDDAAGADQIEPLLPGTSGCAVLVSARCSLASLAARYPVHEITLDVLSPADARTMLNRILRAGRRHVEPFAVTELADLCGQLPLALRISAATLVSRPSVPAGEWIDGLRNGNRLARLSIDGYRGSAVRSAFDQAVATLGPDLRRLFMLLGLVPGPDVTAEAVAALLVVPLDLAERQLDGLVSANLISRHRDRFAFHDLLRLYAAERATDEPDAAAAWTRLCDWYLATTDAAMRLDGPNPVPLPRPLHPSAPVPGLASPGPAEPDAAPSGAVEFGRVRAGSVELDGQGRGRFQSAAQARAWLDAERANLVAAAVRAGGPFSWHLADALAPYFQRGQHLREWEAAAAAGLRAAEDAGYRLGEAAMHRILGSARQRRSGPLVAIRHLAAALDRYRHEDAAGAQATTLCNLGYNHFLAGDMRSALTALDRGVTLIRHLARTDLLGTALNLCAVVELHSGELGTALHSATAGLEIDGAPRALLYINRGEVRRVLGDYPGALADATRGMALAQQSGIRRNEAIAHDALARIRLDSGHLDLARQHAERVLHLAHLLDDAWFEAGALITIGDVYRLRGAPARAGERYARAVRLAIGSGSRIHEAEARLSFAVSDLANGRTASARERAEIALDIGDRAGLRLVQCMVSHLLAAISDREGDAEQAAAHAARAAEIQAETGYHPPPHLPTVTPATQESGSPGR